MPVTPTYPGVYVQEVPSGVRTIAGVRTSVALFIGRATQGPIDRPLQLFNYTDFIRGFGEDASFGDLPRYVRLFFMNGGAECFVMRIADGATAAEVTLKSEAQTPVLKLTAKQAGAGGEALRAAVSFAGAQPEARFNLEVFRWEKDAAGRKVKNDTETWKNLTMDPGSPLYAPTFLTQNSRRVNAAAAAGLTPSRGFSQSGRPVPHRSAAATTFRDAWKALIGTDPAAKAKKFQISVDGSGPVEVVLSAINVGGMAASTVQSDLAAAIKGAIEGALTAAGFLNRQVVVSFEAGPDLTPINTTTDPDRTALLRITTANAAGGDVVVQPALGDDAALPLMLGSAQGGLEVSGYADHRPAPTGITFKGADATAYRDFARLRQDAVTHVTLEKGPGAATVVDIPVNLVTTAPADLMFRDNAASSPTGNSDGVREKLGLIRDAINAQAQATPDFLWSAELAGHRLNIVPTRHSDPAGDVDNFQSASFATKPAASNQAARFTNNVRYYSVGRAGSGNFQTPAAALASDGGPPRASDYARAYGIADREIDLFNLMILPSDANPVQPMAQLYGPASVFCQRRRAFLLMDPPGWTDVQAATGGVAALRIGLVKDHSALFFPRLTIEENGRDFNVGPSGAIAGLMARIDGTRGVWKAPAGTEADLRGVLGLERRYSDAENGALNPRAINTQRVFPTGIVNWGARTMDGDDDSASEYKYIPVRRLALFMEESLYRGLKWVVFEPNGEALWAQIRLNVTAFMHDLFRKGAFAGVTPNKAYFVRCDRETTTPTDENLGIVNIWVGFAPLKPAEFVILYLQQMAAQAQA